MCERGFWLFWNFKVFAQRNWKQVIKLSHIPVFCPFLFVYLPTCGVKAIMCSEADVIGIKWKGAMCLIRGLHVFQQASLFCCHGIDTSIPLNAGTWPKKAAHIYEHRCCWQVSCFSGSCSLALPLLLAPFYASPVLCPERLSGRAIYKQRAEQWTHQVIKWQINSI